MKKLLVVLLSLGLIVAFGATASAADMKVSGSYYVVGNYDNNQNLAPSQTAFSRAYFFQRARLQPVFNIAEGLTFTTRIDALEKQWGNTNWKGGTTDGTSSRASVGAAGANAQESIEFERAYVTFMTKAGQFQVGYQSINAWGTLYGDSETTGARIMYATAAGPVTVLAIYEKFYEADRTTNLANLGKVDADNDTYSLAGIYNAKGIEAGLLMKYYKLNAGATAMGTGRTGTGAVEFTQIAPYAKATFGPVFVEGELNYFFGKAKKSETPGVADIDYNAWTLYVHGKGTFGPAYVGALFSYASGDDGSDPTKMKTALAGGGTSWNPALLLMNDDINTWSGATQPGVTNQKTNVLFYKIYGGFNPTAKLNLEMGLIYAHADKTLATQPDRKKGYGMEADITATYKLYDNLSYMVGAAYLWTGDYFKGALGTAETGNDYLLTNKLSLSF